MKDYMIILKGKGALNYSPEELAFRIKSYEKWAHALGDRFVIGQRLENTGAHLKNEEEIVTDGPFLEANEIIAGYIIIKAKNLEEAIITSKSLPLIKHFELMVRPLLEV